MSKRFTLLKKITMSEVCGLARASGGFKPKTHFGADENGNFAPFLLMRVIGVVDSYKSGTTNYGEYLKFEGNFGAINNDGIEFRSTVAILPPPADALLKQAVDKAEGAPVQMAFDVMAVQDAGDRGYKFQVTPLMEQAESDPLAGLMGSVNKEFALPAPKQAALSMESANPKPEEQSAQRDHAAEEAVKSSKGKK